MVIMAFGALAVDMGYLDYQHMRMQNATDDAALKGARALIPNASNCPNQTAANTAAQADASLNGFAAGAQINVSVHNPPAGQRWAVCGRQLRRLGRNKRTPDHDLVLEVIQRSKWAADNDSGRGPDGEQ